MNGRTRSPLLASVARSSSVRALRGHREVLVLKPIELLRGTRSLRQRERRGGEKKGKIDGYEERKKELNLKREGRKSDGGGKLEDKER